MLVTVAVTTAVNFLLFLLILGCRSAIINMRRQSDDMG